MRKPPLPKPLVAQRSILESLQTQAWLRQFRPADQKRAAELLLRFRLVSRDEFADGLRDLIATRGQASAGPVGLYAERELRLRFGVPNRLFKEARRKVRRAYGIGPPAVRATRAYDPAVGSEGLVAQLITELCRKNPKKFINHPGPDQMRKLKVRAFFVITDLVGSGRRAKTYLEAAWRVRSVRSWWSARFLRFEVLSFAATAKGTKVVERHHCKPFVSSLIPCPIIHTSFGPSEATDMARLCVAYDPIGNDIEHSLGVGGLGTLIAFAHCAPNNAPRIFHKMSDKWTPLFPGRVTADVATRHFGRNMSAEAIAQRLRALNQRVLSRSPAATNASQTTKMAVLLLAALGRPPRLNEAIAERTGLTIIEIDQMCARFLQLGWIDGYRRLTDTGHGELSHARARIARRRSGEYSAVVKAEKAPYYPKSLRSLGPNI
jgi:hypothetical protein